MARTRAGLLASAGTRQTGGRSETLYGLPADVLEIPRRTPDRRGQDAIRKAVGSFLRLAGREFTAALDDDAAVEDGPARTFYGSRRHARLTRSELRTLNRHIDAVEALMTRASSRRRHGRSVAMTMILSPVRAR